MITIQFKYISKAMGQWIPTIIYQLYPHNNPIISNGDTPHNNLLFYMAY
jgi:hypothetical protein